MELKRSGVVSSAGGTLYHQMIAVLLCEILGHFVLTDQFIHGGIYICRR